MNDWQNQNYLGAVEDIWKGKEGKHIVMEVLAVYVGNAVGVQADAYFGLNDYIPYPIIRSSIWAGLGLTVLDYIQVYIQRSRLTNMTKPKK